MLKLFSKIIVCASLASMATLSQAQTKIKDGSVTPSTSLPAANAILELESKTKGLLLPRMNDTEMNAIAPTEGLAVFNTTENCIFIYAKGAWENLCNSTNYCGTVMVYDTDDETEALIDPNAAGALFEPNTPANACSIYITEDGKTWTYKDGTYITSVVKVQPWFDFATKKEASSISSTIYRTGSVNVGNSTTTGVYALTVGSRNDNKANNSIVGGIDNKINVGAVRSIVTGSNNTNSGMNAIIGGNAHTNTGVNALVMGFNNTVTANQGGTFGNENTVTSGRSITFGITNTQSGDNALIGGINNRNTGTNTVVMGQDNVVSGNQGGIFGVGNIVHGFRTLVSGTENTITDASTASATWGYKNRISGNYSTAAGSSNNIPGIASTAIGSNNTIGGNNSIALGVNHTVNGNNGVAIGDNGTIAATHTGSVVMGINASANNDNQLTARFPNGYRFFSVGSGHATPALGVVLTNGSNAWASSSDRRLKNSIQDLGYGLKTINSLRPTSYKFNGQDKISIGFIAQEVQEILPEIVTTGFGDKGDYMGIQYTELIPVLTKAIQELSAKVTQLESENTELKNQNVASLKELIRNELKNISMESSISQPQASK
jgi:hypothetical protein